MSGQSINYSKKIWIYFFVSLACFYDMLLWQTIQFQTLILMYLYLFEVQASQKFPWVLLYIKINK